MSRRKNRKSYGRKSAWHQAQQRRHEEEMLLEEEFAADHEADLLRSQPWHVRLRAWWSDWLERAKA